MIALLTFAHLGRCGRRRSSRCSSGSPRTNVFLMLGNFLPLTLLREERRVARAGVARAYGSAQHPIALAVMLCMLIPLAIYLAKYAGVAVATRSTAGSCTPVRSCPAVRRRARGDLAHRRRGARRHVPRDARVPSATWPGCSSRIAFPLRAARAAVACRRSSTSWCCSFLDVDSLVASQYTSAGWAVPVASPTSGRRCGRSPQRPFFGSGFGSRIVIGDEANAFILDNQFLGTLLETGARRRDRPRRVPPRAADHAPAVRVRARRASAATARSPSPSRSRVSGYIAAIFFYDAFGFFQTFFILCMLLAVGAWLLTEAPQARGVRADARADGADGGRAARAGRRSGWPRDGADVAS